MQKEKKNCDGNAEDDPGHHPQAITSDCVLPSFRKN
jgi:hypothetical protein